MATGASVGALYASLKLDRGQFDGALKGAGGGLASFAKSALKIGAVLLAAFAGIGLVAAHNAEEQERATARVNVTFKKRTEAIEAWVQTSSRAFGVNDDVLEISISKYGDWAKNVGMSTGAAEKGGEALITRAHEIALATGKSFDEVFNSLFKGQQGMTRGLKEYGVTIDKTSLENEALRQGWIKEGQTMTAAIAARARGNLILKQTAQFTAVAAGMQDSLAHKTEQMGATTDRIMDALGVVFLNIATAVLPGVADAFSGLADFVEAHMADIQAIVTTVLGAIGGAFHFFTSTILPIVVAAFQFFTTTILPAVVAGFRALVADVLPRLVPVVQAVGEAFAWIAENVLPRIIPAVQTIAENVIPALVAAFRVVTDDVVPAIQTAIAGLVTVIGGVVNAFAPVMSNGEELRGLLVILGGVVAAVVVPPFVAWAAATIIAIAPILAIAAAVAAIILTLEHFGLLGTVVEGITRAVGVAFDWVAVNVIPALGAAIGWITTNVVPALGAMFQWISDTILPPILATIGFLTETVLPLLGQAFGALIGFVQDNLPTIRTVFGIVAESVKIAVGVISSVMRTGGQVIAAVINTVSPIIRTVAGVVFPLIATAAKAVLTVVSSVFGAIGTIFTVALRAGQVVAGGIGAAFGGLVGVFRFIGTTIANVFKGSLNFLVAIANGIISAVNSIQVHIGRIGLDTPAGFVGVGPFDWDGLRLGHLSYLATGTPSFPGGWAMLGEQGPELARLPRGTEVFNASDTAAMVSGGGRRDAPLIGQQTINGIHPDEVERQTFRAIRRARLVESLNGGRG